MTNESTVISGPPGVGHGGLTIRRSMLAAGVLLLVLMSLLGWLTYRTISNVKVGGPEYDTSIQGERFLADILPPPLFPAEAYAISEIINNHPSRVNDFRERLNDLHQQFTASIQSWETRMADAPFMDAQTFAAIDARINASNAQFWDELLNRFMPAVDRNDTAARSESHVKLLNLYLPIAKSVAEDVAVISDAGKKNDAEIRASADSAQQTALWLNIGACLFIGLTLLAAQRLVITAITRMSRTMLSLAGGHLDTVIPYLSRRDEVGQMAAALDVLKAQACENRKHKEDAERIIGLLGQGLEKLAKGVLTHRIVESFPGALDRLRQVFNQTADSLQDNITTVKRGTDGIKSGTEEIAQASDDLSRRTESQAASLEETAAAVAQITATVKKKATGAMHARGVVTAAKDEADKSGQVVRRAVEAMQSIEHSSQKITQILGVIDEIAFQTNLLALNAGVEVARAGDAGRGFAVVASEVRALTQRSADAAKEIKGVLSTSATQVEAGINLVAETGTSLRAIIDRIGEINSVVNEIAVSAEQQATGLQEVNTAVDRMDHVTQQNAAMVEEATAATRTLTLQSNELAQLVARFTVAANQAIRRAAAAETSAPKAASAVPPQRRPTPPAAPRGHLPTGRRRARRRPEIARRRPQTMMCARSSDHG